jgi:hypothetical protein
VPNEGNLLTILAYLDANKQPFDGCKTYKLHLPANAPPNDFWAMTLYDTQTRAPLPSMGSTATVGSQTGVKPNNNGSYDIYFGPKPPKGYEKNWLETIPGKSWFTVIRIYGSEAEENEIEWDPSGIELID